MRMSQTSLYAIRAALQLCNSDERHPIPCSELARRERISVRFLNQILGKLVKRGVLRSTIGASGGYELGRAPEDITLLELIVEFEHDLATDIVESPRVQDKSHRLLMTTLATIFDTVFRELEKVTLADLQRLSTSPKTPQTEPLSDRSDEVRLTDVDANVPNSYLYYRTNS
jgi:Rrf2 family protein